MPDIYDQEIERLSKFYNPENPAFFKDAILDAWSFNASDDEDTNNLHSPLFDNCDVTRVSGLNDTYNSCGCLTQVRNHFKLAYTRELTELIGEDDRIPENWYEIKTPEDLQVFAEWQRRLDKEIPNRLPPVAPAITKEN